MEAYSKIDNGGGMNDTEQIKEIIKQRAECKTSIEYNKLTARIFRLRHPAKEKATKKLYRDTHREEHLAARRKQYRRKRAGLTTEKEKKESVAKEIKKETFQEWLIRFRKENGIVYD